MENQIHRLIIWTNDKTLWQDMDEHSQKYFLWSQLIYSHKKTTTHMSKDSRICSIFSQAQSGEETRDSFQLLLVLGNYPPGFQEFSQAVHVLAPLMAV